MIKVEVSLGSGIATIEANRKITVLEINQVLKDTSYQVAEE